MRGDGLARVSRRTIRSGSPIRRDPEPPAGLGTWSAAGFRRTPRSAVGARYCSGRVGRNTLDGRVLAGRAALSVHGSGLAGGSARLGLSGCRRILASTHQSAQVGDGAATRSRPLSRPDNAAGLAAPSTSSPAKQHGPQWNRLGTDLHLEPRRPFSPVPAEVASTSGHGDLLATSADPPVASRTAAGFKASAQADPQAAERVRTRPESVKFSCKPGRP